MIGAHNNEMINKNNEMFNEIAIFVTNGFEREYEYVLIKMSTPPSWVR